MSELRDYEAVVRDPQTGESARFRMRALTPENAVVQAKNGFTGLLGSYEKVQARLEVTLEDLAG
jgi:hypothetical protein